MYLQIQAIRNWYKDEHSNYHKIDGKRSKWWVWNRALEVANASIRQIQTYLQRIGDGRSCYY